MSLTTNVGVTQGTGTTNSVSKGRCSTCTHGARNSTASGNVRFIECHFGPRLYEWPQMAQDDWCSQHEAHNGTQEKARGSEI